MEIICKFGKMGNTKYRKKDKLAIIINKNNWETEIEMFKKIEL